MTINHCRRCGREWCFTGAGRALRCGKCKSPYWDRERQNGGDTDQRREGAPRGKATRSAAEEVRAQPGAETHRSPSGKRQGPQGSSPGRPAHAAGCTCLMCKPTK